jgi:hypothetical protein
MQDYSHSPQHSLYTDINRLHGKYFNMEYSSDNIQALEADIDKLIFKYKAVSPQLYRLTRNLLAFIKSDIISHSQYLSRFNHIDDDL